MKAREKRHDELVETGETELHLRLDAKGPRQSEIACRLDRVVEEGSFTDTRLAA